MITAGELSHQAVRQIVEIVQPFAQIGIGLPDHPGALVRLSTVIAEHKVNIVETSFNRSYYGVVLGDTAIDITMETRGPEHIAELKAALDAAGYSHEQVQ